MQDGVDMTQNYESYILYYLALEQYHEQLVLYGPTKLVRDLALPVPGIS